MRRSIQAALLDHDVLADDQAMRGHLSQLGQHTADVLIGVNEGDDNWQLAARLHKMGCAQLTSALKACDRVEGHRPRNILLTQIPQHLQVQRMVMPGIALRKIHRYLYGHGSYDFTTSAQWRRQPGPRPGRVRYSQQCLPPSEATAPAPCRQRFRRHNWRRLYTSRRSRWRPETASADRVAPARRQG